MSCTSAITVLVLFITYAIQALLMKLSLREVATNSPVMPPLGLYVEPSVLGGPGVCMCHRTGRCTLQESMLLMTALQMNVIAKNPPGNIL